MKLRPSSILASLTRRNNIVLVHRYVTGHRKYVTTQTITRNIATSLRLLVPSSLQVWRPSAEANHYRFRSQMPLGPVGMIRRFWRAFTRLLASCSLLSSARSRRPGGAVATARTVRQVRRRWPLAFSSSAASSYVVGVLSPLISPSKSLSPEVTGATELPAHRPPVPMVFGRPRPR
jgi:hypothetical protein